MRKHLLLIKEAKKKKMLGNNRWKGKEGRVLKGIVIFFGGVVSLLLSIFLFFMEVIGEKNILRF